MTLRQGLIFYEAFEESGGNSGQGATDSIYNNTGQWQGTVTNNFVAGKIGKAGFFDGTDNSIIYPAPNRLNLSGNQLFTLSAWVNPSATVSDGAIVSYGPSALSGVISIDYADTSGTLKSVHFSNDNTFATKVKFNQWNHVVITYDGTNEILYFNGIPVESWQPSSLSLTAGGNLWIGGASWNSTISAKTLIDEVGLWNRALRSDEVKQLYNNGLGLGYPFQYPFISGTPPTSSQTRWGYTGNPYLKNSFLHTVGRIIDNEPARGTSTKGSDIINSRIIIDFVKEFSGNSSYSFNYNISSLDRVLVILLTYSGASPSQIDINGMPISALNSSNGIAIYYTTTPPSGSNTINITKASGLSAGVAITLLGVDKKELTPLSTTSIITNGSSPFSQSISIIKPYSLIIDVLGANAATLSPSQSQYLISNISTSEPFWSSFKYVTQGSQSMSWNRNNIFSTNLNQKIISFSPINAQSIWFPNISQRNSRDIFTRSLITNAVFDNTKYVASNFFQNSFLHTIGRILPPKPPVPTAVNETERPTSQIIIDKIFQGQIAAVALSTVTLSLQISIPSSDAVLVVTGGSVIATGNPWANVQLNGNNLEKIVQASVAGADAEIWYMPNPPVGTYTLLVTSGTGGEIYANAMVLLGVDKKNTNLISASTTDAASTSSITTQLQNDSQGAFIIDTVSASDSAQPIQDQLQTQVFNANALAGIENVLSTYKIAQPGQVTMSYNLTTAVNAAMVTVAFRQAKAASMWNPNIDFRTIDDIVTTAGLDAERNPAFGNYGYKPSIFYQNSFLQTIGRRGFSKPVSTNAPSMMMLGVGM